MAAAQGPTEIAGTTLALFSVIDTLRMLLQRQSPADRAVLLGVIETLNGLEDLITCISRYGDEHPRFRQLYDEWRTQFRQRRKDAGYPNLALLEERTGIASATLHALESGHRPPSLETIKTLLATPDLGLDKQDLFVQIVLNRSARSPLRAQ